MRIEPLRVYLLTGLLAHKIIWIALGRSSAGEAAGEASGSPQIAVLKTVKVLILTGLIAQTLLPHLLPISSSPAKLSMVGSVIYSLGWILAVTGRVQLGKSWSNIENARLVEGQKLVSGGIYKYIRHPIYAGDVTLVAGLELALNSWLVLIVCILVPYVYRKALQEENVLASSLPGYGEYVRRTKRFVPFLL